MLRKQGETAPGDGRVASSILFDICSAFLCYNHMVLPIKTLPKYSPAANEHLYRICTTSGFLGSNSLLHTSYITAKALISTVVFKLFS